MLGSHVTARNALELPMRSMSWRQSPAHWTYRAISRYIRRHVMRELDRFGPQSTAMNGQRQVANLLRLDRFKQLKPMEMDWAMRLDEKLHLQALPFLPPWTAGTIPLIDELFTSGMLPSTGPGARYPLSQAARCWLAYHATGKAMMARLREETQKIGDPVSVVSGHLHVDSTEIASLCDWSAVMRPDGSLRFLSLSSPGPCVFATAPSGPDKTTRSQIVMKTQEAAERQVFDACAGPCLTWTNSEGWYVTASVKPSKGKWRRQRLFGVQGTKPFFWIFVEGDRFVARLCSFRLQTFGATAKDAIDTLRWCFQQQVQLGNLVTS